ncbi:MAG TPA: GNAT family N-acetyltransferase [Egibacteraceae bacterium]|jgi:GNAT superfamily N-acetyltransferase|nr:GNAT family N-acetyltransferase [Egibacteraceae bacterium]
MHEGVSIRPARDEELDGVAALLVDAYAEYAARMSPDAWASFAQDIGNVRGRMIEADVVVAERDGRLVGSVTLFTRHRGVRGGTVGVRLLAVHPDARGTGVGRALMEYAIERARAENQQRVVLSTTQEMESARDLYEKLGFVRDSALDHEPAPGVRFEGYALNL